MIDTLVEKRKPKRGGARPGAGRKKGERTVRTSARTKKAMEVLTSGEETPLDVMIAIMRKARKDGNDPAAMAAAREAAPYVHPRLSTTKVQGDQQQPLKTVLEVAWLMGAQAASSESESPSPTDHESSFSLSISGANGSPH